MDTLTYTKNNGVITKTFAQIVTDVAGEISLTMAMKQNVESAALDSEGNVTRAFTQAEQDLINQYDAALLVLEE